MSNARKPRNVKRQTFYLLRFWDGLPAWAVEQYGGCRCGECGKLAQASPGARETGAAIVAAKNFDHAIQVAWHLGCNPGGEVMGGELPLGISELQAVGVPVGELIADTANLDHRLRHAMDHLS